MDNGSKTTDSGQTESTPQPQAPAGPGKISIFLGMLGGVLATAWKNATRILLVTFGLWVGLLGAHHFQADEWDLVKPLVFASEDSDVPAQDSQTEASTEDQPIAVGSPKKPSDGSLPPVISVTPILRGSGCAHDTVLDWNSKQWCPSIGDIAIFSGSGQWRKVSTSRSNMANLSCADAQIAYSEFIRVDGKVEWAYEIVSNIMSSYSALHHQASNCNTIAAAK